jgi:DUF1680 family protein
VTTLFAATLAAPVVPTAEARGHLRPIGASGITVTGGFWADRLTTNRKRTIPHGFEQLKAAGTLNNLRLAAGASGAYRAIGMQVGLLFPFLDSDVYKWLEATAWELGHGADPTLSAAADEAIALVSAAQRPDGYLNSFVQVVQPGTEYQDLAWGHELYCLGHLIQAAVAWQRALGDDRLLNIAVRAADSAEQALASGDGPSIDGHPEVEMALVELYRVTGQRRHLDAAAAMIDARGHGRLGPGRFGAAYWQDHLPLREAETVAGHAVRQVYLDCGAVDVATELGDEALLDAVRRRWQDMVATRTYLTGGLGCRPRDESFGDPFELPPDGAYAETCAAIGSVMLAWRLLLATGEPEYADLIERTVYNGVLPAVSADGIRFFYENRLQRRTDRAAAEPGTGERAPWYACACCPPNLMRLLSSWPQYLATSDAGGLQIHQFAPAEIGATIGPGHVRVEMATGYPWDGRVSLTIVESPSEPWTLSMRIPGWSQSATIGVGGSSRSLPAGDRQLRETRVWHAGDTLTLDLEMGPRVTEPDVRIDAVRGCVALERGPLVYCLETEDLPTGIALEAVELGPNARPAVVARSDIGDGVLGLQVAGRPRRLAGEPWPYLDERSDSDGDGTVDPALQPIEVNAIPYYAWANRNPAAMRVWIPRGLDEA